MFFKSKLFSSSILSLFLIFSCFPALSKGYNHYHDRNFSQSEHQASIELKILEQKYWGSHFYSRHGAQTTLSQQKKRAMTGLSPDGFYGRPTHGFRWIRNSDLLFYFKKAEKIHRRTGQRVIDISAPKIIGEGYLKGRRKLYKTNRARFIFKNDKLITAYPLG